MAAAVLLAAACIFPVKVSAVSARKAIVLDGTTGRVLYEKDANSRSLIASTTKIMTALIVCEQCNVLDRMRIPKEAVGIEGSSMYLKEGEVLTLQEISEHFNISRERVRQLEMQTLNKLRTAENKRIFGAQQ